MLLIRQAAQRLHTFCCTQFSYVIMIELTISSFCSQVGVYSLLIVIVSSILQVFVIYIKTYQVKGFSFSL